MGVNEDVWYRSRQICPPHAADGTDQPVLQFNPGSIGAHARAEAHPTKRVAPRFVAE